MLILNIMVFLFEFLCLIMVEEIKKVINILLNKVLINKILMNKVIINKVKINQVIINKVLINKVIINKILINKVIINKVLINKVINIWKRNNNCNIKIIIEQILCFIAG